MRKIKRFPQVVAAILSFAIVMTSIPCYPVVAAASETTLSDGTVVRHNPDGSKTVEISVTPEEIVLNNQGQEEERLIDEGEYLISQGEAVATKISTSFEEGKELVTLSQEDLSISFQPIVADKPEKEEEKEPTYQETDIETETDVETDVETETPEPDSETALPVEEETLENESELQVAETEIQISENETQVSETESQVSEMESEPPLQTADLETGEDYEAEVKVSETEAVEIETRETEATETEATEIGASETKSAETKSAETELAEISIQGEKEEYQNGTYGAIRYEGLFSEVTDVYLAARKAGIKEDIILNEYMENAVFEYLFSFQGLFPEIDGRQILLKDFEGTVKAIIAAPFMTDANQAYSEEIEVTLVALNDGYYAITYSPSDEWLREASRAFPVIIDPTVTYTSDNPVHIEDNYISSQEPNTNHYFNETFFKVGNDGTQTHIAYIRPVIPDSLKAISSKIMIKDADIRMYEYSGKSSNQDFSLHLVTGGEWSSRAITYSNAPSFTGRSYGEKKIKGSGWYQWDLKELFSEWFHVLDQKPNYGFALFGNTNASGDSRTFYSADSLSYGMTFSVTYFEDIAEPSVDITAKGSGVSSGTGYVDLTWEAVKGAEAYYVGIFNGKDFEYFFNDNKRTFTTKGKGIWPTETEIKNGKYALHSDEKGAELPMIPAFTYDNVKNGSYGTSLNYYFKIVPCNEFGQAPNPGLFDTKSIRLPDTMPPNQAAAVTVNPSAFTNTNSMVVSWSGVTDFNTTSPKVVNTLGDGKIQYAIDGTANWKDTNRNTASGSDTFDTSALGDGTHVIYIRGCDAAGNTGAPKGCNFYIDRTGPTAPALSVIPEKWTDQAFVQISWSGISDLNPMNRVEYSIDGGTWISTAKNEKSFSQYQVAINGLADGIHSIKVRGVDTIGNIGQTATATIYKDTKIPTVERVALQPTDWSNEKELQVDWEGAADAHSGLKSISYAIDEEPYIELMALKADDSLMIDISGLSDGEHMFHIKLTDALGHELNKSYPFYRDSLVPQLEISAPANGDIVNGNMEVWGVVQDISLKEWKITARGLTSNKEIVLTGINLANQELIGVVNTAEFVDGESIELVLSAEDEAGNQNRVSGIVIKVDKSAKAVEGTLQITSPGQGEAVKEPQIQGTYQKNYAEAEAQGYYYIDGIYQGKTNGASFAFDAIRYKENSMHSFTVISQGESGKLYYSGGLAAYMMMSETFSENEEDKIETGLLSAPKEIMALRLHSVEELLPGTSIEYHYSVDGGVTWLPIANGADIPLTETSRSVRLQAILYGVNDQLPTLRGWELEGILEMTPLRAVSRLLGTTEKLVLGQNGVITKASTTIPVTPKLQDKDKKWLFADHVLHQSSWLYDALSAKERSSHEVIALAQENDGTMYASGAVSTELLLRVSEPVSEPGNVTVVKSGKLLFGKLIQCVRLLALTDSGQGNYYYSPDGTNWKIIATDQQIVLDQSISEIYLKAELPAGTTLKAWHLEGIHATGQTVSVQLLKDPTHVMAEDYGKLSSEDTRQKYELTWKDPNGEAQTGQYETSYNIYRNHQLIANTNKLSYVDKAYVANAVYAVEIKRIYKNPDDIHTHYLTRMTSKVTAQTAIIKPEEKVEAANYNVEDFKQSEAADKLYGGNYIFSTKDKAPTGEAALNERLLGKSNYCMAGFEPINFNTGNFYLEAKDYSRKDLGETQLIVFRTYNTQSQSENGPFGAKWEFDYGQHLVFYKDNAIGYRKADGALLIFRKGQDGSYSGEDTQGFTLSLNQAKSEYIITEQGGGSYHFSMGGLLSRIQNRNDSTKIEHDKDGKITEIVAPSGRKLKITMDAAGHIVKITTPSKAEMTYTYAGNKLTSFTDLDGNVTKYLYDEKDRMTEWYDGNGNCQVFNQYDEKSRVVYQEDARKGKYKLEYFADHTITTDAEGKKYEIYFDAQKRTIKEVDGKGNAVLYSYNEQGYRSGMTDKSGQLTAYEYDQRGNKIKEIAPDGAVVEMKYDQKDQLTAIIDQNGNTITYQYDQNGNRTREENPEGSAITYVYDHNNQIVKETNELGYVTAYEYDKGLLIKETDPEGNITSYKHDKEGNMILETNALGEETKYEYDAKGNVTKIIFADQACVSYQYDALGNKISYTDLNGNKTTYEYDALSNLIVKTDAGKGKETTKYSLNNLPLSLTNAAGETLSYTYDDNGNQSSKKDAESNITKYEYDADNRKVKEILPTGAEITYQYDETSGALTSSVDQMGRRMQFEYDKTGNITKQTLQNGGTITMQYDKCKRLIKKVEVSGGENSYTYNKAGWLTDMVDPQGAKTHYDYNKNGQIVKITDGLGQTQTFQYDKMGRTTQIENALGAVTKFTYDKANNLISQVDGLGNTQSFAYDANGNLKEMVDPLGNATSFDYNVKNSAMQMMQKNGGIKISEFDAAGRTVKETDVLGNSTEYAYNAAGLVTKVTDAMGQHAEFSYDALGNLEKIGVEGGGTTTYLYDKAGRITSSTDELGLKTEYSYDEMSNVSSVKVGQKVTKYGYDKSGNIISVADDKGRELKFRYNLVGQLRATVYAEGIEDVKEYDALGRLIKEVPHEGYPTEYKYDAAGNLISQTCGEKTTGYEYDKLGRLTRKISADGSEQTFQYDVLGNLTQEKDALGNAITYTYDTQSFLRAIEVANGTTKSWEYDLAGRILSETNGEGQKTQYGYDALSHLTSVTDAQGNKTIYEYGPLDKVTEVTDALGNKTTYTYDSQGNVLTETDALGQKVGYTYTAEGLLAKQSKADGTEIQYTYDKEGNLLTKNQAGKEIINNTYDELGRVVSSKGANGEIRFGYDDNGTVNSVTASNGDEVKYTYDSYGRKSSLIYPQGKTVSYTYDSMDRMTSVKGLDGATTKYTYDKAGRRIKTEGDGINTSFSYDESGNLIEQNTTGNTTLNLVYSYNKNNEIVSEQRTSKSASITSNYQYDGVGQLSAFTRTDGKQEIYAYDKVGNMIAKTTNGQAVSMSYNRLNQLEQMSSEKGSIQYAYDPNGNLVEKKLGELKDVYQYDAENKLTGFTGYDGYIKDYTYDPLGMLSNTKEQGKDKRLILEEQIIGETETDKAEEKENSVEEEQVITDYIYDITAEYYEVLAETKEGMTTEYDYGLERISAQTGNDKTGNKMQYIYDGRGSVAQTVTTLMSAAQINNSKQELQVADKTYLPFGEQMDAQKESGYGYNGEAYDAATGFINLRARQYEPTMNRFNQKDLVKGNIYDSQSLNPYLYVKNNPVNLCDPSGMVVASAQANNQKPYNQNFLLYATDPWNYGYFTPALKDVLPTKLASTAAQSTAAQSAAEAADRLASYLKIAAMKYAYNGNSTVTPEVQKILDEFYAKVDAARKAGTLTNEEGIKLLEAACSAVKASETGDKNSKATKEEIILRTANYDRVHPEDKEAYEQALDALNPNKNVVFLGLTIGAGALVLLAAMLLSIGIIMTPVEVKKAIIDGTINGIIGGVNYVTLLWSTYADPKVRKEMKEAEEAEKEASKAGNKTAPKTNKEVDEAAKDLGYEKTNEKSHGQTVYKNKKGKKPKYITRDVDSHNGGAWKGADTVKDLGSKSTRTGTYDGDLNWIGD